MNHWGKFFVKPDDSIQFAISVLDSSAMQICLVVDDNNKLLGTVTDGDIRRGILRSLPFETPVSQVMNISPVVGHAEHTPNSLKKLMLTQNVRQVPRVDDQGHVIGLSLLEDLLKVSQLQKRDNSVVLMAGGIGSRLQPLTHETPKPLLQVGKKPILERILESLIKHDFYNFFITVNYKAQMLKDHFGDGSQWGVSIRYLEENEPLGTAGAIGLIEQPPQSPILVVNGDVLTAINFDNLMEFHAEQGALATMCVRDYEFQVPYGVITTQNMKIVSIDEKPSHRFFVNAGIYVLEPTVLEFIPKDLQFDMTDLFLKLIAQDYDTTVFPIREYWLDIGRMDDFQQANLEFHNKINKQ